MILGTVRTQLGLIPKAWKLFALIPQGIKRHGKMKQYTYHQVY